MRVLVLSTVYPNRRQPNLGVFVHERIRRVAHHVEVVVAAPVPWFPGNRHIRGPLWSGIPAREDQDGVTVYHPRIVCIPRFCKWSDGLLYAASLVPFLLRLRRQFPFDLIDAHFAYPDGLAAVLLGRIFRRPVVITLRGSIVRLATYPLHRPQLAFALRAAARVISVSASLKRAAVELGIPAEKIRVIPNGVDTTQFFPLDRVEARRALGLPAERPILLSVGGVNEGKGHHRIVGLLPALRRHHPDLLYVVVGEGRRGDGYRANLQRRIADMGVDGHVVLAGERPHAEVPRWLAAADLLCLATRSEGWANVLLEALACGRPVVTTAVGGNPEIVTSDRLGILVPPGDDAALAQAIHEALGRRWDEAAMVAHARTHSWERTARQVAEGFFELAPMASGSGEIAARWLRIGEERR